MIDPHFEGRSGFRHYSRLPDPWRPEDDSGRSPPQFCFSLSAGLIVYGSAHL
jgi:hypothetical protein